MTTTDTNFCSCAVRKQNIQQIWKKARKKTAKRKREDWVARWLYVVRCSFSGIPFSLAASFWFNLTSFVLCYLNFREYVYTYIDINVCGKRNIQNIVALVWCCWFNVLMLLFKRKRRKEKPQSDILYSAASIRA